MNNDRFNRFAKAANGAKEPKELCEAIKGFGTLSRYCTIGKPMPPRQIHIGNGTQVNPKWVEIINAANEGKCRIVDHVGRQTYERDDKEPALEEAKAVYAHARQTAIRLKESNPSLPPIPPPQTDPYLGMQTIQEWCLDAEGRKPTPAKGKPVIPREGEIDEEEWHKLYGKDAPLPVDKTTEGIKAARESRELKIETAISGLVMTRQKVSLAKLAEDTGIKRSTISESAAWKAYRKKCGVKAKTFTNMGDRFRITEQDTEQGGE